MDGIKFYMNKFDKDAEEKKFVEGDETLKIGKTGLLCSSILPPYDDIAKMV
ncbi:hypothetical protein KI387_038924, partial [Taxus chinensis]